MATRPNAGLGDTSERHVKLSDLLPDSAIREVIPIMQDIADGKLEVSNGKKALLAILEPHRAELLARGSVADFLAWQLAAIAAQSGGRL